MDLRKSPRLMAMHDQLQLKIDLTTQTLDVIHGGELLLRYPVSTARNGPGERVNSECTPRGRHVIAEKIGGDVDLNTVFVGRRVTGEVYSPTFAATQPPNRDWIITRILWLAGCEPGVNQGDGCDSYARYIYIHGTPDITTIDKPGSRGCVRMRNEDIIELFSRVKVGTPVVIHE